MAAVPWLLVGAAAYRAGPRAKCDATGLVIDLATAHSTRPDRPACLPTPAWLRSGRAGLGPHDGSKAVRLNLERGHPAGPPLARCRSEARSTAKHNAKQKQTMRTNGRVVRNTVEIAAVRAVVALAAVDTNELGDRPPPTTRLTRMHLFFLQFEMNCV